MKFTQKKFESLKKTTAQNKISKLIYEIYLNWNNKDQRTYNLKLLENLLVWHKEKSKSAVNLINELSKGFKDGELRKFDKFATTYLMETEHNLKDDFVIYKKDFEREKTLLSLYLILDNLRSLYNVGAIFRTAECFGVTKIFLIGYTPTPNHKGFSKTSMGTEKMIDWEKSNDIEVVLKKLKAKNVKIYALELTSKSLDINTAELSFPAAIILGNEALGIDKQTLKMADKILYIPLFGNKNSLNVASSAAIALNVFATKFKKG